MDGSTVQNLRQLISAIKKGEIDTVSTALDSGAFDVNSSEYKVPLIVAAKYGRANIAKLLLEKGAQVDLRDHYERSALMTASEQESDLYREKSP